MLKRKERRRRKKERGRLRVWRMEKGNCGGVQASVSWRGLKMGGK